MTIREILQEQLIGKSIEVYETTVKRGDNTEVNRYATKSQVDLFEKAGINVINETQVIGEITKVNAHFIPYEGNSISIVVNFENDFGIISLEVDEDLDIT